MRVQKELGAESLEVLLLSVDRTYGDYEGKTRKRTTEIFKKLNLSWPNVWLAGGWDECIRTFNLRGYGLTLVDSKGIVRGIHVQPKMIKRLLKGDDNGG